MRVERQVLFWLAVAIAVLAAIALLKTILLPFVAGMVLAYFLNPIADRLERTGLGRLGAAIVILAMVAVVVVVVIVLLVPFVMNQTRQLADNLPADLGRLKTAFDAWAASCSVIAFQWSSLDWSAPSTSCRRTGRVRSAWS